MKKNTFIQLTIAFLLTFMGGFCDGYTYLHRGAMLSYMQTGNLIKFCIALASGSFEYAYLIPIVSFCLGCLLAALTKKYKYYTHITLLALIVTFIGAGFFPVENIWNIVVVSILSFVGAMHFLAFNKCLDYNYTSTMCTNNMRLFSSSVANKNIKRALFYLAIIISFGIGVTVLALLYKVMGDYTIALGASFFLIVLIILIVTKADVNKIEE